MVKNEKQGESSEKETSYNSKENTIKLSTDFSHDGSGHERVGYGVNI